MPTVFVMVMKNAINKQEHDSSISHIFDLKGSKVHRKVLRPDQLKLEKSKLYQLLSNGMTLKDLDLMHIQKFMDTYLINVSPLDK
jgi:hypothetical protein